MEPQVGRQGTWRDPTASKYRDRIGTELAQENRKLAEYADALHCLGLHHVAGGPFVLQSKASLLVMLYRKHNAFGKQYGHSTRGGPPFSRTFP